MGHSLLWQTGTLWISEVLYFDQVGGWLLAAVCQVRFLRKAIFRALFSSLFLEASLFDDDFLLKVNYGITSCWENHTHNHLFCGNLLTTLAWLSQIPLVPGQNKLFINLNNLGLKIYLFLNAFQSKCINIYEVGFSSVKSEMNWELRYLIILFIPVYEQLKKKDWNYCPTSALNAVTFTMDGCFKEVLMHEWKLWAQPPFCFDRLQQQECHLSLVELNLLCWFLSIYPLTPLTMEPLIFG